MNFISFNLFNLFFAIALISCSRVPIDGSGESEPFDATPPERTTLSKGRSQILKLTEQSDIRSSFSLSSLESKITAASEFALEKNGERIATSNSIEKEEEFKEIGNLLSKRKSRSTLALINPDFEKKDD